jgi:hypothetical protein
MRIRDLIAVLVELRNTGRLDEPGNALADALEGQARRGIGPTLEQRQKAVAIGHGGRDRGADQARPARHLGRVPRAAR